MFLLSVTGAQVIEQTYQKVILAQIFTSLLISLASLMGLIFQVTSHTSLSMELAFRTLYSQLHSAKTTANIYFPPRKGSLFPSSLKPGEKGG